jgi:hypothetical protein
VWEPDPNFKEGSVHSQNGPIDAFVGYKFENTGEDTLTDKGIVNKAHYRGIPGARYGDLSIDVVEIRVDIIYRHCICI